MTGEDGLGRQVGGETTKVLELAVGEVGFDLVPPVGTASGVVGVVRDDLDGVRAVRAATRIGEGGCRRQHPRDLVDVSAVRHRPGGARLVVDPACVACRHRRARSVVGGERRRLGRGVIRGEERHADVVGVDAIGELLAP